MRITVKIPLSPVRLFVALMVLFLPICSRAADPQLLPKIEQPMVHSPEKIKLSTEETTPVIVREQKEKAAGASSIETLISSDEIMAASEVSDENPTRSLTQFGYSYFLNLSLLPQIDIQVSPDYLVGPGDSIVVTVWGSIEGSYDLVVSSGGEVNLPKVGPVRVAGLPFGKLAEVFRVHLAKVFRDFDLAVNMGKLRTNKISVIGEVASPGDYTVSSLATVLNALSAAGGPTKNGSLRGIKIRRAGKPEVFIDLYDFFLTGDKNKDLRLSSGDTIFVPVIGRIAAVAGKVKRPAIYELKNETTLKELITLAEGITATGYLQRVQISRVIANQKKQVIDLNLDPVLTGKSFDELAASIPVQDMDIVKVFPINRLLRNHFKLEGHVERPGFYALKPGIRISSVLNYQLLLPEYAPTIEVTRLYPPNLEPRKILLDLEKALAGDPVQDTAVQQMETPGKEACPGQRRGAGPRELSAAHRHDRARPAASGRQPQRFGLPQGCRNQSHEHS
jgi:polysaccharide export outer membrane protein